MSPDGGWQFDFAKNYLLLYITTKVGLIVIGPTIF